MRLFQHLQTILPQTIFHCPNAERLILNNSLENIFKQSLAQFPHPQPLIASSQFQLIWQKSTLHNYLESVRCTLFHHHRPAQNPNSKRRFSLKLFVVLKNPGGALQNFRRFISANPQQQQQQNTKSQHPLAMPTPIQRLQKWHIAQRQSLLLNAFHQPLIATLHTQHILQLQQIQQLIRHLRKIITNPYRSLGIPQHLSHTAQFQPRTSHPKTHRHEPHNPQAPKHHRPCACSQPIKMLNQKAPTKHPQTQCHPRHQPPNQLLSVVHENEFVEFFPYATAHARWTILAQIQIYEISTKLGPENHRPITASSRPHHRFNAAYYRAKSPLQSPHSAIQPLPYRES